MEHLSKNKTALEISRNASGLRITIFSASFGFGKVFKEK